MINKIFTTPLIIIIKFYQITISPILGNNCIYLPTCSEYTLESLRSFGLIKGLYLSSKRILKCHPWNESKYDPLPKKIKKQ